MKRVRPSLASLASLGLAVVACSTADPDARVDPVGPTTAYRESFLPVARAMMSRCGMLDCHGSLYRNFRLYGYGGARLPVDGRVVQPDQGDITPAEALADYQATIAIEPERMRRVLDARGAGADELTLLRKGRNEEDHDGKNPMSRGDSADRCITSWLAGSVDVASCETAAPPR